MTIDELSQLLHPPNGNVRGAPPPEHTPDEETIDSQKPDLSSTCEPAEMEAHRHVVGVENAGGKAYGKANGLNNKHRKYSEQWNPSHPFQSAHDLHTAQSFSQPKKTFIDQHLSRGLANFNVTGVVYPK
jgi:hypothetical protein